MKLDINKFSFPQMVSNSDGKTSSSGFCGVFLVVTGVLCFIYGCFEFHSSGKADIMMYSSANILSGIGLLGYRKSVDKTSIENGQNPSSKKEQNSSENVIPSI